MHSYAIKGRRSPTAYKVELLCDGKGKELTQSLLLLRLEQNKNLVDGKKKWSIDQHSI